MKKLILLLTILLALTVSLKAAQPQWRQYCSFDNPMQRVVDTPDYVYFTVYGQPVIEKVSAMAQPKVMLYRYDKQNDELLALNGTNDLRANLVNQVHYNPGGKYLLAIYNNYDMDLIFDNGAKKTISDLRLADNIRGSRAVNDVSFYPEAGRIYVAGDFGMLEIDDKKGVVVSSRIYNRPLTAIARTGDRLLLSTSDGAYFTSVSQPDFSLTDMTALEGVAAVRKFYPCSDGRILVIYGKPTESTLAYMQPSGNDYAVSRIGTENITAIETMKSGLMLQTPKKLMFMGGGNDSSVSLQADDSSNPAGSWDGREFWFARARDGFYSKKLTDNSWTITREPMHPNVPAVFIAQDMVYHPRYGMLMCNYGYSRNFNSPAKEARVAILISGLKDGHWTNYGPTYDDITAPARFWNPLGITVDPDNSDRLWFGSAFRGIIRVDLADPSGLMHLSYPADPTASATGFVNFVPTQQIWPESCAFTRPMLDADGRMWTSHYNNDYPTQLEIWSWSRNDRVASETPSTFRPWTTMTIDNTKSFPSSFLLPCKASSNRGLLVFVVNDFNDAMVFIDTNGTPEDPTDDKVVKMTTYTDQDGEDVKPQFIFDIQEDPSSGLVWVASSVGVFTVNPRRVADGEMRINRIKVSRNDGTNLADYLLNNVQVNKLLFTSDRIWFGTNGGGLVSTSRSGSEILGEYTTSDSGIPGDIVYGIGYNPESNSLLVSTDQGLGELYLESVGLSENLDNVKAYPNPVRPDYHGYVTIDGLVDGSLVKITDSAGNLVKELGPAEGGTLEWDLTNLRFNAVNSGVYYVLASSGPDDENNFSKVTKVLVIR